MAEGSSFTHRLMTENPIHENNPHYLSISVKGEGTLINSGFEGIAVKEGAKYNHSVFLNSTSFTGEVSVRLIGKEGTVYGEAVVDTIALNEEWQCFEAVITSKVTDADARFAITFKGEGELNVDMISLFPEDTWNKRKNGLRKDLVQSLYDLKPKFVRFPGGCIVEGKYLTNAYNWKHTVGPVETRKMNWNRWEEGHPYPYKQSYGLGFYEYFQLSEDVGATPLPVVNCGMSCQFQGSEIAEIGRAHV